MGAARFQLARKNPCVGVRELTVTSATHWTGTSMLAVIGPKVIRFVFALALGYADDAGLNVAICREYPVVVSSTKPGSVTLTAALSTGSAVSSARKRVPTLLDDQPPIGPLYWLTVLPALVFTQNRPGVHAGAVPCTTGTFKPARSLTRPMSPYCASWAMG